MITVKDVEARCARLDKLGRGLAKETVIIRAGHGPFLRMERLAYLDALHRALHGIEGARIALAKALQRIQAGGEAKAG